VAATIGRPASAGETGKEDSIVSELERVRSLCEAHGIHTVECMFADTWGIPRGKRLPVEQFLAGHGFAIANVCFTWDMHCFIFPTGFVNDTHGYPDMHAVPDFATFRLCGWRDGVGLCICDTVDVHTHEPVPLDGREILRRQVERVRGLGFEPQIGTELEFHLCNEDWSPYYTGVHCYSIAKGAEVEHVAHEIRSALAVSGVYVEASNVEYGPAQVEVNLRFGPALDIADGTMIFKYAVREIARKHGLRATFMAKPYIAEAGNGMHVHQSLRGADGRNAFGLADLAEGPVRSSLMRAYLGGLLAHQVELTAVNCPTINGYKRFEDYSFAPTQVSWALDHRLVAVRMVIEAEASTRIESRGACADANPYLVIAGVLAAGADGIERGLEPPPITDGDPHADTSLRKLPGTLADALAEWRASAWTRAVYGEVFADTFTEMLEHELHAFHRQVTEWERERYREVM
jgi:glutamine synthetase